VGLFLETTAVTAPAPPSGTLAFFFTDIEGSTVRWDRDATAMTVALRRHDCLMREAIGANRGHVFKTIGDAFCAVFPTVDDGVCAAIAAQRALADEDFSAVEGVSVRMALHVGTADERDGDYFGPTLNRVARLLAVGHGGQVLLSATAAALARTGLQDVTLRDLGEHRLKDLSASERIYQLEAPGLGTDFPRLASLAASKTNLTHQLSSFIGREREVAAIYDLLRVSRLVTVFGTGGLGKTRCSLQVGAASIEAFPDGVWFTDLAAIGDPALVPNAVADIFGIQESPRKPILETLIAALRSKDALLILDNCEHVIETASQTAAAILRGAPKIKIIATSREALKIAGEVVYRMPSLTVPERGIPVSAAAAVSYEAIALFADRARAANGTFVLTDADAPIVADICRRLDGIPLAIELAAVRINMLSPRQLVQKLDERFRLLTGGDRTAMPRQQTMRALIDWSYDLLDERERAVFRALSISSGGFSLESATLLASAETIDEFDALDALSSLVDKSFVLPEASATETRYRLLESIRQYGYEKLVAAGERDRVALRHAATYAGACEALERDFESSSFDSWRARAEAERENARAALGFSFGPGGDVLAGQRIAATLRRVFIEFAAVEARRWIATALTAVTETTPLELAARLHLAEATTASTLSQFRAASSAAERALALFEELDDARGIANARRWAGRSLVYLGSIAEGETMLRDALATFVAHGFTRTGGILRDLAAVRGFAGDVCAARSLYAQALERFKDIGDEHNIAVTAGALAETEFRCGDVHAAVGVSEEGIAAARILGEHSRVLGWLLRNLAAFLVASGSFVAALERAKEALRLGSEARVEIDVAFALQHIAAAAALRPPRDTTLDDERRAARILGFVDERLAELDVSREETEQTLYDATVLALGAALSEGECASLLAEGSNFGEDRVLAEAALL